MQSKFELFKGGRGTCRIIVYGNERDPEVKEITERASGKKAFWVPDEFCFEAQAIKELLQKYLLENYAMQEIDNTAIEKLKDEHYCAKRGISRIQAMMLYHFLTKSKTFLDTDNAYSHVIDGYLLGGEAKQREFGISKVDADALIRFALPKLLANSNKQQVKEYLDAKRTAFREKYPG